MKPNHLIAALCGLIVGASASAQESLPVPPTPSASTAGLTIRVNGAVLAQGEVPMTAAMTFTANDCLDIGSDLGSPVALDYYEKAPFAFNGVIETTTVKYLQ